MKVSELIVILEKMKESFGDLEIRHKSITFQDSIIASVKVVPSTIKPLDSYICID